MTTAFELPDDGLERRLQADEWYGALRNVDPAKLDAGTVSSWQEWLLAGENRRAFDSVSRILDAVHAAGKHKRLTPDEIDGDPYDGSARIIEWRNSHPQLRAAPEVLPRRRPHVLAALSAAFIAGASAVGAFLWRLGATVPVGPEMAKPAVVYQIEGDENEDVRLQDGSTILLAARTNLSVSFTRKQRAITLNRGTAWFHVAHKPDWPFIVIAGQGTIVDLGTAFVVDREPTGVVVTVTEGAVQVDTLQLTSLSKASMNSIPDPAQTVRLTRGERISYDGQGMTGRHQRADVDSATTWIKGNIEFDDMPLRDVVRAVNRYANPPISISPEAGRLMFTGIISPKETGDWLESLRAIFPVSLVKSPRGVCISMRDAPRGGSMRAGC